MFSSLTGSTSCWRWSAGRPDTDFDRTRALDVLGRTSSADADKCAWELAAGEDVGHRSKRVAWLVNKDGSYLSIQLGPVQASGLGLRDSPRGTLHAEYDQEPAGAAAKISSVIRPSTEPRRESGSSTMLD